MLSSIESVWVSVLLFAAAGLLVILATVGGGLLLRRFERPSVDHHEASDRTSSSTQTMS